MNNETNYNNIQKKSFRWKHKLAAVVLLFVLAGLIYRVITWTPVNVKTSKASEERIRHVAYATLTDNPRSASATFIDKRALSLTDKDFAKVTELYFDGKELSDIRLIEKFTNLQTLTIRNNRFSKNELPKWMLLLSKIGIFDVNDRFPLDISPLEKIPNLQNLWLYKTKIKNTKTLSKLVNLRGLDVSYTGVSNLKQIKNLTNLECLIIRSSRISDIKQITGLQKLQKLTLNETKISNIGPLKDLTNLQLLVISDTKVSNLEPLKGLINLSHLNLGITPVSDIEPIRYLTNMEKLWLNDTKITNIDALKEFKKLRILAIANTQLSDIKPLENLTNLEIIFMNNTEVSDLEPLKQHKNLKTLFITNCSNIKREQVDKLQESLPNLEIKNE